MEGFTQGRPGILSMYSPSGLLKMSIKLCQQDGLYYSTTDTFTVNTNPRSSCSPFVGSAFTDISPEVHLIDEDEASDCSGEYDLSEIPVKPTNNAPATSALDSPTPPIIMPRIPKDLAPPAPALQVPQLPRSWVRTPDKLGTPIGIGTLGRSTRTLWQRSTYCIDYSGGRAT
jgi:hypothetical protein